MRRALLADPFWVAPSEVERLTDREMWLDYLKPALERQRREDGALPRHHGVIRPDDPDGTVRNERGEKVEPDQVLFLLMQAGMATKEQVEEAVRRKQERLAQEKAGG